MAAARKIRLFKIASEINIGRDAIVDYLNGKGFDIQNKPTAALTEEMVESVYEKFKKEKRAAEKQREKLQRIKEARKPKEEIAPSETKPEIAVEVKKSEPKEPEEIESFDVSELTKTVEPPKETPQVEKVEKAAPELKKDEPKAQEKVVPEKEKAEEKEKVEPEKIKSAEPTKKSEEAEKVAPPKKEKPAKELKPEKAEPETIEIKDVQPKKEDNKTDKKEAHSEQKPAEPKSETKAEIKPEAKAEKAKKVEVKPKEEEKAEPEKPKEEKPASEKSDKTKKEEKPAEAQKKTDAKKRKKHKKILQVDVEPGQAPKLRGLTIVGKIDLEAEKEKRRQAKAKKTEEAAEDKRQSRREKTKKPRQKKKANEVETPPAPPVEKTEKPAKSKTDEKKRRRRKKSIREQISSKDVDKAIKQTLAGMDESASAASQRSKIRQKRKIEREEKEQKAIEQQELEKKNLELTEFVTTNDLARLMNVPANEIIMKCIQLGLMVTINQRLDKDTITVIADDYGFNVDFIKEEQFDVEEVEEAEENLESRAPIVTIMGHVDHGKTSLLDFIRHTNVVAGEAGGITQHVGAYRVALESGKHITFLDTPGHEAFTAMRARGAQVTDIVVLVVAADDAVMPQTEEAISHAQAAEVPIVIAINKIDKPDARPDRIKQQLADRNILVEEWGGKYQSVEISAKSGQNVESLLETILLEAEMLELKADPTVNAAGVVVEANMDKGFGAVATVIVQKGTLEVGNPFVAGAFSGKVRAMFDERDRRVQKAGPTIPVRITGFDGLPEAGDVLRALDSDSEAKNIANQRQQLKREQELRRIQPTTLDDISQQISLGDVKDLKLIIKGDVSGSVEAISDSLLKLSRDEVKVQILHKGVGAITESDVMLAVASGAVIIGFQVSPTAKSRKLAEIEAVDIRQYNIIYDCINEIQLALEGLLTPEIRENTTANVEIRKVFKISKIGYIAGCYVKSGKITRSDKVRLLRDGLPIYNGSIGSLKRGKDDVKEVEQGFECGIMLDNCNDIKPGDFIEGYELVEIKRKFE